MDPTPLIKAHDHARAAAVATRQASDTTVAVNEHTHAAGEFASAARNTSSVEALRTLKLLEEHHRRLAELLNLASSESSSPSTSQDAVDSEDEKAGADKADEKGGTRDEAAGKGKGRTGGASPASIKAAAAAAGQKSGPPGQRRIASREMSSSIASNLASARGIRTKTRGRPLSPSISNDQGTASVEPHPRRGGSRTKMKEIIDHQHQPATGKPGWVPPMPAPTPSRVDPHLKSQDSSVGATSGPSSPSTAAADESGYSRFYNTFGSLINKISTPLALAGLPLIQEESSISQEMASPDPAPSPSTVPSSRQPKSRPPPSMLAEADLSKIYSKATMRAIAGDGHGSAADSFYVVPTSGHTVSYARILSYSEKEKQRKGASLAGGGGDDDDMDDFADARDGISSSSTTTTTTTTITSPTAPSAGAKQRTGRGRNDRDLANTVEELYTENQTLKVSLDKLTKRLHTFEASAQNMAESYRLMRPGSPLATASTSSATSGGGGGKSRASEEELAALRKQVERLERDNEKMQKTLEKYRDKWEMLKAGAKARREAQGVGADSMEESAPA